MPYARSSSSQGVLAIAALVLGFAFGIALRAIGPGATSAVLAVAEPVGTLWVNAIRMTVIPLMVSLVITGIAQSGGTGAVARLGGRSLGVFALLLTTAAAMTALLAPAMFAFLRVDPTSANALRSSVATSAGTIPELPTFASWVTGLIPSNPVKAAVDGTMLPLLAFTAAFGLAVRAIPRNEREAVVGFFRSAGDAMLVLVRWALALAPIGIAGLATALGAKLGVSAAGAVAYYLGVHVAMLFAVLGVLYLLIAIFGSVGIATFTRAAIPAQAVAMGTRSSLAAIPAMLEAAEQRFGVPRATAGFLVPFAVSLFRLNVAVSWIVGALFIGALYNVPLPAAAIVTIGVASVAMSFSVPGIPSGSLFIVAPLFPTVGLPVEGVGILIALDALPDVFKTLLNVTGHLTAVSILSRGRRGAEAGDGP
ncbi:MAG: Proton/glutamate-aspartate symporter [Gemmatimonadaceae bacterium]|nr:Proton/glutamate-aspartate symporter [Gemmatimonadaceae bacterium]